jgi:hypothetical protein
MHTCVEFSMCTVWSLCLCVWVWVCMHVCVCALPIYVHKVTLQPHSLGSHGLVETSK